MSITLAGGKHGVNERRCSTVCYAVPMTWIRTVYLYLFALVGLALIIIGSVLLVDLGLKIAVFRQADQEFSERPPFPPEKALPGEFRGTSAVKDDQASRAAILLTEEEKQALDFWEQDYQNWKERQGRVDMLRSRRERTASRSIAFLLVGVPLFLYHWRIIARSRASMAG